MRHIAATMMETRRSVDPNIIQNLLDIPESEKFQRVAKRKSQSKIERYILPQPRDKISVILRHG